VIIGTLRSTVRSSDESLAVTDRVVTIDQ
jgi:hypothetical protein